MKKRVIEDVNLISGNKLVVESAEVEILKDCQVSRIDLFMHK